MNFSSVIDKYKNTDAAELLKEGLKYLQMTGRCIEKNKFTPEIVYDFFLMGAEKCLVSCLLDHGEMPIHHTLEALMESLEVWEPIPSTMHKVLVKIESRKDICSLVKPEEVGIDEAIYPELTDGVFHVQKFLLDRTTREDSPISPAQNSQS